MSTTGGVGKIVTDGLILYYDGANPNSLFNSSTTINDLTINDYNGDLINGATYTTDKGGGVSFDGVDDTLDLGTILDGVIAGTSPTYTIQTWVKFDTLADDTLYCFFTKQGAGNNRQLLISLRNLSAPYNYGAIRIEHIPYSVPGLIGSLPSVRLIRSDGPTTIETNKIYNITISFDGSINTNDGLDRPTFYIDGVLQDNVFVIGYRPLTNTFQTTTMKVSLNGYIGTGTSPSAPFGGATYQTLFYDRVLTQEEVLQNYNTMKSRFK